MTAALPPLRPGLRVLPGPAERDGSPSWTIHDPLRDRYFRLGWREHAMLEHWHQGEPGEVAAAARVPPAEVTAFLGFLAHNELLAAPEAAAELLRRAQTRPGPGARALHGYLFFRLPLLSPEPLVARVQPVLDALLGWRALPLLLALLAGWGVIQTLRQWEVFLATLPPVATAGGLALYGAMLVVSAVVHEFGHAYAARRAGCRVGRMGVAVMVLVPTLYTDMSDAWTLPDRRRRLQVGLAGVAAEGVLVLLALALWPLLPEGAARSALVALATTALATTLAINLNPLMRFDGYYLLSDLLELPNLQSRAFALWRWRLRRRLFAVDMPPPERPPRRVEAALLTWASLSIPWRVALYLGIALLVYHAVFKLAGILLFAVELWWFLLRPCWHEGKAWWSLRGRMDRRRLRLTGLASAGVMALALIPWSGSVELGAVLGSDRHSLIFAPMPARLAELSIARGAAVAEGETLMVLTSPELGLKLAENQVMLDQSRWQLDHLLAQGTDLGRLKVEQETLAGLEAERSGLLDQERRLRLTAPFAGTVVELRPGLEPGLWLDASAPVAALADPSSCRVEAYAEEGQLARLRPGAPARFYPDDPGLPALNAILREVEPSAARRLDDPYFHADRGGPVAIRRDDKGRPVPAAAVFRLRLEAEAGSRCPMRLRGHVVIEAPSDSLAGRLWRWGAAGLRAESGW